MTHPDPTLNAIRLAVDGSPYAEAAARYAGLLSRRLHLPLHALHVIHTGLLGGASLGGFGDAGGELGAGALGAPIAEPGGVLPGSVTHDATVYEAFRTRAQELLGRAQRLAERAPDQRKELRTGFPADEILRNAQADELLVLGRQGEGTHTRPGTHLGGVAERVLRRAPGAVLLTPERFLEPRRVLLAYDGSQEAAQALPHAVALAGRLELPLVAVSVRDGPTLAEAQLEAVHYAASRREEEIPITKQVLLGDAVEAILAALREGDLLAIGAFGEGRLSEFFRGSTTEALLRGAEVPVLLRS